MTEDRKFSTRLDQQIGLWLLKQEKIRQSEQRVEERRVLMECVAE